MLNHIYLADAFDLRFPLTTTDLSKRNLIVSKGDSVYVCKDIRSEFLSSLRRNEGGKSLFILSLDSFPVLWIECNIIIKVS